MTAETAILEFLTASLVRPFLLVAAAAMVLGVFRVEHPVSHHAVWSVALGGIFVLPFAVVLAPHIDFAVLPESVLFSMTRSQALDEDRPSVNHASGNSSEAKASVAFGGETAKDAAAAGSGASGAGSDRRPGRRFFFGKVVVWIYLTGLVALLAYRILGWLLLLRVRARSTALTYPWLRESPDVVVPIAVGIIRPTVLLPCGWRQWPAPARRAALAHEFAHIRRGDAWGQALSRFARCVFWFHPLVWWVSRKVGEFAEMSCDAAVLQRGVDPFRYSRVLLDFSDVVRRNGYRASLPGLAIMGRSWLSRRIDHVIAMSSTNPRRLAKPVATLILVGMPMMAASATLRLTERGGLRILPPAIEQRAAAALSSTLESIVEVATGFTPAPLFSQALPANELAGSQTAFATRAFLDNYCLACHNNMARMAAFSVENLDLSNLRGNAQSWEKVILKLRSGIHAGPLPDSPGLQTPQQAEVQAVVAWLEDGIDRPAPVFQGSPTARPLNRTEYANGIRDLLGIEVDVALLLPADDSAYGFDNIASVLEYQRQRLPADTWSQAAARVGRLVMSSPVARNRIFVCRPVTEAEADSCASMILTRLAAQAYRGKETSEDIGRLIDSYRDGAGVYRVFDIGIEAGLRSLLSDRKFLYRDESSPADLAVGQSYAVDDVDLANRLSFFLWSAAPDSRLLDLARQGRLKDPAILENETRRMLQDAKAEALALNFAGQWLWLRRLNSMGPMPLFKDFDEALSAAMRREAEMFFQSIIREDRNAFDLLNADYTFLNERLARHYGIPNVAGDDFRRVVLGPEFDNRRGLLGKAAVLTVTSRPTRTSIVTRGTWVLSNIMGAHPPDPPPNLPPMPAKIAGRSSDPTMRELMERHNSDPRCHTCHRLMDPIGITLENFDAIGKWRTEDEGKPIDSVVDYLDGIRLTGPADLRSVLNARSELFMRTLTQKLLTYALGRGATYEDMPTIRAITREAAASNNRFSAIVLGIVRSPVFQMNVKR